MTPLTHEERLSPLWRKLKANWDERLAQLHSQNEGNKSEVETANLRGRIAEIKLNLSLVKPETD